MSKFWSFLGRQPPPVAPRPDADIEEGAKAEGLEGRVIAIIKRECPAFSTADLRTPFDRLGIDSVGMLMIHTSVEESIDHAFANRQWDQIVTPADLINALRATAGDKAQRPSDPSTERRTCVLNMPQMALGGLSESWLFKELGDTHWSVLAKAFACPSHLLRDETGERIYATFTRIQLQSSCPLADFNENERVALNLSMSRHGAGIFFGQADVEGNARSIRATLMSTFSKFGENASNMSLLRGLPEIPPEFTIPVLTDFPQFGQDYRLRRSQGLPPAIFECEYEIIPAYDINGVGLLYFAAYPIINDICASRHAGRLLMIDYSTLSRDIFYFGNSNPDEVLLYRLHEWRADERSIDMMGSISRKSDGVVIAHVVTRKVRPSGR
jgi:probable biosynthetic protein (TIGR04098 family)